MKCFLCGRDFKLDEMGNDLNRDSAFRIGNKAICINCLHTLNILLRRLSISSKKIRGVSF